MRPKVCFDRFKITNAIRNIHDAVDPRKGYFIRVMRDEVAVGGAVIPKKRKIILCPTNGRQKRSLKYSSLSILLPILLLSIIHPLGFVP
jgi:hypothetical protein